MEDIDANKLAPRLAPRRKPHQVGQGTAVPSLVANSAIPIMSGTRLAGGLSGGWGATHCRGSELPYQGAQSRATPYEVPNPLLPM